MKGLTDGKDNEIPCFPDRGLWESLDVIFLTLGSSHGDIKFTDGRHQHCQSGKAIDYAEDRHTGQMVFNEETGDCVECGKWQ